MVRTKYNPLNLPGISLGDTRANIASTMRDTMRALGLEHCRGGIRRPGRLPQLCLHLRCDGQSAHGQSERFAIIIQSS